MDYISVLGKEREAERPEVEGKVKRTALWQEMLSWKASRKALVAAGPASEDRDGNHFILGQADTVRAIRAGTQL